MYKLDLKLREIKANLRTGDGDKPFGGIAIFFFGDIMQLKPVRSKYKGSHKKRIFYDQADRKGGRVSPLGPDHKQM